MSRKGLTPATMELLRELGYVVWKVEYWNSFAPPHGKRVDLFNCIDVIGLNGRSQREIGVQSTSRTCVSQRIKKIRELVEEGGVPGQGILAWIQRGNSLEVWGWDLQNNRRRVLRVTLGITDGRIVETNRRES